MHYSHPIKLIAMDMDGTLLNSKQQVSPGNAAALQRAHEQGVHLAICSGRPVGDIGLFALENGLQNCTLLSLNGTYCATGIEDAPFANHCFVPAALERMVDVMERTGELFACFSRNTVVGFDSVTGRRWDAIMTPHDDPRSSVLTKGRKGLQQVWQDGVNKIVFVAQNPDNLKLVRSELEQIPEIDVTSSWKDNLEIMPKGFHKGTAVHELAQSLGIAAEEVMTFGDYDNDAEMIAYAGLGVAMGNATERIRRLAKYITLTNDEDGVAWAVERFVLK